MSSQSYTPPAPIACTLCRRASKSPNEKVALATVACIVCQAYQCHACDIRIHARGEAGGHQRYPVERLKSFIDFESPTKKAAESHVRSHLTTQGKAMMLEFEGCQTSYHTFRRAVQRYPHLPCLGVRSLLADGSNRVGPYVFQTYAQVNERITNLAAAMQSFGLEPKARVGLYSVNRPEWIIGEQACYANNFITVPLYDTLGPDAAEQIIEGATLSVVLCSQDKVDSLMKLAAKHAHLKYVIVMGEQLFEMTSTVAKKNPTPPVTPPPSTCKLITLLDAEKLGSTLVKTFKPIEPTSEDISTLCYTSGTTGAPKGAMITHGNIVNDFVAASAHSPVPLVKENEYHISYLPLAHIFERLTVVSVLAHGGAIGFSRGNPLLLLEDIEALRPTTFAGVPRLYNRLYDKVLAMVNTSSPIKRWLFNTAYNQKLANLRATGSVTHPIWDRIVFSNIAAKLGGRTRLMVTGSAPIADNVLQFLRICFSCHVVEGYGQTETTAAATLTRLGDDRSFGNVGTPLVCTLVKLVAVPEMGYTENDVVNGAPCPRGEVCFKGYNVFAGYYQDKEKTQEALDEDGWLHSGDIGMWLPDQTLKLIDRKKNLFKTAQGEYISPEKIENIYQRCSLIAQAFVHGDSLESSLVGIIVPEQETVVEWAAKNKVSYKSFGDLVAHPLLKQAILQEMDSVAKENKLAGFEQVKTIHLVEELFSVENNLLTPTFKLKRNIAQKKFEKELNALYGKGEKIVAQIKSKL